MMVSAVTRLLRQWNNPIAPAIERTGIGLANYISERKPGVALGASAVGVSTGVCVLLLSSAFVMIPIASLAAVIVAVFVREFKSNPSLPNRGSSSCVYDQAICFGSELARVNGWERVPYLFVHKPEEVQFTLGVTKGVGALDRRYVVIRTAKSQEIYTRSNGEWTSAKNVTLAGQAMADRVQEALRLRPVSAAGG